MVYQLLFSMFLFLQEMVQALDVVGQRYAGHFNSGDVVLEELAHLLLTGCLWQIRNHNGEVSSRVGFDVHHFVLVVESAFEDCEQNVHHADEHDHGPLGYWQLQCSARRIRCRS